VRLRAVLHALDRLDPLSRLALPQRHPIPGLEHVVVRASVPTNPCRRHDLDRTGRHNLPQSTVHYLHGVKPLHRTEPLRLPELGGQHRLPVYRVRPQPRRHALHRYHPPAASALNSRLWLDRIAYASGATRVSITAAALRAPEPGSVSDMNDVPPASASAPVEGRSLDHCA